MRYGVFCEDCNEYITVERSRKEAHRLADKHNLDTKNKAHDTAVIEIREKELPVCPECKTADKMKIGWMKTRTEGIIEVEVVECQSCGWTGLKSDVKAGRSPDQSTIGDVT